MKITLLLSVLALVFFSNAQTLQIVNQYVFGGDFYDSPRDAIRINNNTVIGGVSMSENSGDKTSMSFGGLDAWILSLDNNNAINWQKSFGGVADDYLVKIIESSGGDLLVGSHTISGVNGNKTAPSKGQNDFWLIKIDGQGNEIWQKSYGGSGDDILLDMIELSDGSVMLIGHSDSPISGDKTVDSNGQFDFWIVKIDGNGNVIWDKAYGGNLNDFAEAVTIDENEDIYISGRSNSPVSGDKTEDIYGFYDIWILKIDSNGNILWEKTLGGDGIDLTGNLIYSDNSIYILGNSVSDVSGTKSEPSRGLFDVWITKMSQNGIVLMDKTYGGNDSDQVINSILTSSGELVLACVTSSDVSGEVQIPTNNNSTDFWIIVLDTNDLSLKNQFMFGGDDSDLIPGILEIESNSILLYGTSNSDISGDKTLPSKGQYDFWLLELSTDLSTSNFQKEGTLSIYPNPTSNSFQINEFPDGGNYELNIIDMMGKSVLKSTVNSTNNHVDVNSLSPGMYTLQMIDGEKSYTSKLIVE